VAADQLERALDDVRVPPHASQLHLLELKVELRRVERRLSQHVAPHADQSVRVVVLPMRDPLGLR
jgi:hypothetical protein